MATSSNLSLDFETFSKVDLKKCGVSRYSRDVSTEVLMCAYAFDDDPVKQWLPVDGDPIPPELLDALTDPHVTKRAWNAVFERQVTKHVLGLDTPWEAWRCTMVLSMALSLPASLAQAGTVVGVPADKAKMAEGKRLIKLFCLPQKPTKNKPHLRATAETDPEKWAQFCAYNIRDVEAERTIYRRIRKWDLPPDEWANWVMDCEINERGLPVNMTAVDGAVLISEAITQDRLARMREITGLENPNSGAQLLPWLRERGYPFADLVKGHVKKASEGEYADNAIKPVLGYRAEISKASVKKFTALKNAVDDDGYLRFHYQFAGAGRTLRIAGRIFQPTNLPRPPSYLEDKHEQARLVDDLETLGPEAFEWLYTNPMEAISAATRPVIEAPAGHTFAGADLNAIEDRGAGYLAGDDKTLDVYRDGRDPYVDFATQVYNQPYKALYEEFKPKDGSRGSKVKRNSCKPAKLGCNYGLSAGEVKEDPRTGEEVATGLLGYAWGMGIKLTPEEATRSWGIWRNTYAKTVSYWYDLGDAFKYTIRTGKTSRAREIRFEQAGPFVRMVLPGGGLRYYCRPKIEPMKMPWGDTRDTATYEGLNTQKQWVRIPTRGSKLFENAVQSVCRDLMYNGAQMAAKRGLDIRLTIYDEIVTLATNERADKNVAALLECMTTPPDWAPDFPMGAAGDHFPHFVKD